MLDADNLITPSVFSVYCKSLVCSVSISVFVWWFWFSAISYYRKLITPVLTASIVLLCMCNILTTGIQASTMPCQACLEDILGRSVDSDVDFALNAVRVYTLFLYLWAMEIILTRPHSNSRMGCYAPIYKYDILTTRQSPESLTLHITPLSNMWTLLASSLHSWSVTET